MKFSPTYPSDSLLTQPWKDDQREALQFGMANLPSRQELVLKSMMRLLDNKLDHKWFYSTGEMDLCILADGLPQAGQDTFMNAQGQPAHVLAIGFYQQERLDCLLMPVRVDELFLALNRIGKALLKKKSVAAGAALAAISDAASAAGAGILASSTSISNTDIMMQTDQAFRLTRWPSFQVVGTLERVRMATLLTAQPLRLAQLQRRSGYPMPVCEAFVRELAKAGLLYTPQPLHTPSNQTAPQTAHGAAQTGSLPAPVRAMLSPVPATHLAAGLPAATSAAARPAPARPVVVKAGLLDKIRSRLGLGGSGRT